MLSIASQPLAPLISSKKVSGFMAQLPEAALTRLPILSSSLGSAPLTILFATFNICVYSLGSGVVLLLGEAGLMKALMPVYYSPRHAMHHYLHMAQGNIREYLKGERVWVKKYFYVLRPLLACRWIEAGLGVLEPL